MLKPEGRAMVGMPSIAAWAAPCDAKTRARPRSVVKLMTLPPLTLRYLGPVPKDYTQIIEALEKKGLLEAGLVESQNDYLPTEVYSTKAEPDMSVFDEDDRFILQRVVARYGKLTGKQLEDLTHGEAPFIATEQSQDIAFDLAFYRGTDFSDAVVRT